MQIRMRNAHLVLEDGAVFPGIAVGAPGIAAGEACFTTSMAGYEESVTDPSYIAQVLVFSYPLIGNYEIDEARLEADTVQCEAVVMRRARPHFSRWLADHGVVAIEEVDTRRLVRHIRDAGAPLRCALGEADDATLLARALAEPPIDGRPLARHIGVDEPVFMGAGPRVALIDLGCKRSIPRRLAETGGLPLETGGGPQAPELPVVRLIWGKRWNLPGVVVAAAERLERFTVDGSPQRSWLRLLLRESHRLYAVVCFPFN